MKAVWLSNGDYEFYSGDELEYTAKRQWVNFGIVYKTYMFVVEAVDSQYPIASFSESYDLLRWANSKA